MSDFVCLNFGTPEECPNCGGWCFADSRYDGHGVLHADEEREPYNVEGIYGLRFCSEDCAAEYEEHVRALAGYGPE